MRDAATSLPVLPVGVVAPVSKTSRDPRLDVFRGICLVMIFINHVPGNAYEAFTSRNFGFSDAAEGFVMMAGIAAGLAYSADFRAPMRLWAGVTRVWKRCWTLYLVQMTITLFALAAAAAVARYMGNPQILFENNMDWLWRDPLGTMIGLPLLLHQFGYLNILPLYIVLLFVAPLLLIAAWRRPLLLWAGSFVFWLVAGIWLLDLPLYPMAGGWHFNPLTWQAVFVTGLLIGVAMKDRRRLVPVRPWLQWLTGGFLLFALVNQQVLFVSRGLGHGLWILKEGFGVPWNLTDFEKTFLTLPRLLHILALTYFLSSFAFVRRACGSRFAAPFGLLGRHSLPVFATGSVMAIGLQGIRHTTGWNLPLDTAFIGGGLAILFGIAAAREYWPNPRKTV